MKRASYFLTTLVLASLLLAACGAQVTSTSVPNTSVPMATSTSEMPATEVSTATEAATSTPEGNMTGTPAIPVTGGNGPSQRITTLIGSPVCGMKGDQLGTVKDLVLDFNQALVTYMIVEAKGKTVAVPYSFLIKPRTGGTGTSSGTGSSSGLSTSTPSAGGSGTGTLSTSTPSTGAMATSTPATGAVVATATSTTKTGTGTGTGNAGTGTTAQQNCLTLTLADEIFNKAPAFDKSVMPGIGQTAKDWDTNVMDYWASGGAPAPTATPSASSGGTSATPAATAAPGLQAMQGVILASDLLGKSLTLNSQGTSAGTGTSSGTGTGSSLSTSTPSSGSSLATSTPSLGSSSTAVPDTTATASSGGTGTGSSVTGTGQDTVQDVIIDARIGKLQYLVISTTADTWVLVPISLLGWDVDNSQAGLMTDASMLQNAPSFSSSEFPDVSTSGWDQQFSSYWKGGGSSSGSLATPTP